MKYPYFGKSKFGIVLFTAPEEGICVEGIKKAQSFKLGQYSKNWGEKHFGKINISKIQIEKETSKMFSAKEANELRESFLAEPFDWVAFKELFKKHIQENPSRKYLRFCVKISQHKEFCEKMIELGYEIELLESHLTPGHINFSIRY